MFTGGVETSHRHRASINNDAGKGSISYKLQIPDVCKGKGEGVP